ncbi:MAG: alpha/beta hydrolase [Bacillota bacterium]
MYEGNTKLLFARETEPFDHSLNLKALREGKTESERVPYVHAMLTDELDTYQTIPLWDGTAPFWKDAPGQREPRIAFFPAAGGRKSGCVLVAPGGAYNCVVAQIEGYPIIRELVRAGISAALLSYRVKPFSQYISLIDAQRALRLLRARAGELNIHKDRIAIHGSSAGGHLSCMAAVHHDPGDPLAADAVDRESCRPDAAIISYGVFSQSAFPRTGAFIQYTDECKTLEFQGGGLVSSLGDPDIAHKFFFSAEKHVTPQTPPFFIWQTCDMDDPRQAYLLGKALADAGVRCEMHIFPFGPHGLGIATSDKHIGLWVRLAIEFLDYYGF